MFESKESSDFKKKKAYWEKLDRPVDLSERLMGTGGGGARTQGPDHTGPEGHAKECFSRSMYLPSSFMNSPCLLD